MSFEEQIMPKEKYPSIFFAQNGGKMFIILQIFFATSAVLKIRECHPDIPQFKLGNIQSLGNISQGIFRNVTRLDQSHASKNI